MNPSSVTRETRQVGPRHEDDFFLAMVLGRDAAPTPAPVEDARRAEKEYLARRFRLPAEQIFMLEQVHGTDCLLVGSRDTSRNQDVFFARGDTLLTGDPDILLCIRTADCLPVFFVAYKQTAAEIAEGRARPILAGVAHAGWRGLRAGVLETALERARAAGGRSFRIFRGPCIGGDVYEVGPEVAEHFEIKTRNAANRERETWLLDLTANAAGRLEQAAGKTALDEKLDHDFQACVYRANQRYYSHRRGDAGRNLNIIMLKAKRRRD